MSVNLIQGDCMAELKKLPAESINCCVTSPPYWGLRDYGTAKWIGGNSNCDHVKTLNKHGGERADRNQEGYKKHYRSVCGKCGAKRIDDQLGLEKTPEEYVGKLVNIFKEVRRVLKSTGTVWLNLGDSYNGSGGAGGDYNSGGLKEGQPKYPGRKIQTLKPKDLAGIPWRVAFALQADGWYLRSDIIWHKPNPMPESVTDRPTKSHEYIFLLSKSKRYYYDAEAIREPYTEPNKNGRNKRSVWTVTTKPFKGAHFAVFPEDLIKPCILAGCPESGTTLDPFMGSGTVGVVCKKLDKSFVGIELNAEYTEMARKRIENTLYQETMW